MLNVFLCRVTSNQEVQTFVHVFETGIKDHRFDKKKLIKVNN